MELTGPRLPPEIWAETPAAAQPLVPQTTAGSRSRPWRHQVVELLPLAVRVTEPPAGTTAPSLLSAPQGE